MRTHTLVFENQYCNIWKIEWPQGTGLDWHHHGESNAEIIMLEGILFEEISHQEGETEWYRHWFAGKRYTVDRRIWHRVVNEEPLTAVSLHIYSPPLVTQWSDELEISA